MEVINSLSTLIIAISTVVLVVIICYYVRLTGRLLRATNQPEIVVSIHPHDAHINIVMLCIENIGPGSAHNVQFATDLSFKPDGRRPLEKISFLKNGITYFQPGRKIEQFLVSVTEADKFEELKQTPLEIGVTYTDSVNHKHERTFQLDFGEHEGLSHVDRPPQDTERQRRKAEQKKDTEQHRKRCNTLWYYELNR